MFFLKKNTIHCIVATLVSYGAIAQLSLEETVIVASKYPQKQSQVGRIVNVIPDSLIRANQHLGLGALLNQQVGVQVQGSGQTPGSIQSVFTRGASSGYTLILLDGVPVYDPSNIEGNFDINFIPLQSIERIEVLKGGQSTLYGSNAVAGVINIITKKSVSKVVSPNLSLNFGSFNSVDINVGGRGMVKNIAYDIGYQKTKSDGFSSAEGPDFENDGLDRSNFRSKVSGSFGVMNLRLKADYSSYKASIDAGALVDDRDNRFTSQNLQVGGGFDINLPKTNITLNYLISDIERTYEDDSTDVPLTAFSSYSLAKYSTLSNFLDLYANFDLNNNLKWLLGGEYRSQDTDQSYFSISPFGPFEDVPIDAKVAQMSNYSLYSSLGLGLENGFGAEVGFRANHHSTYNWNSSYTLSTYYQATKKVKVMAIWANSFKNPSLYQLFSPYGNLELSPEKSRSLELGIEYRGNQNYDLLQLNYFNRKINNGIIFNSLDVAPFGKYVNNNDQRDQGVEFVATKKVGEWLFSGNYTFLTGFLFDETLAEQDKNFNLIRRPQHVANITSTIKLTEDLLVSANIEAASKRKDRFYNGATFATEEVELKPYVLIHLQANYALNTHTSFFGSLRNITNTKYQEIYGFNSEPINFKLGFNYQL